MNDFANQAQSGHLIAPRDYKKDCGAFINAQEVYNPLTY
jgi:hypothetical protein